MKYKITSPIVACIGWIAFVYAMVNMAGAMYRFTVGEFLGPVGEIWRWFLMGFAFMSWWRLK